MAVFVVHSLALGVVLATITGPPPPRPTEKIEAESHGTDLDLRRLPDGGFIYRDRDAGFTAEIRSDGTVRFRDTHLGPQQPTVEAPGLDLVRGEKAEPQKPFRDDLVPHGPYGPPPILMSVGMRMGGVSDALIESRRYRAKQEFMKLTAKMRAKMAGEARRKHTARSMVTLTHELLAIWEDATTPLSVRKRRIFELWDDCSEAGPGSDRAAHAGDMARRRIEKFIRTHARSGGPQAYTEAELRRLNARRKSTEAFAPYQKTTARASGGR